MLTRLMVAHKDCKIILGRDLENLFEVGEVYELKVILGVITIVPIGKCAMPANGFPSLLSEAQHIITDGRHLITEEECEMPFKDQQY